MRPAVVIGLASCLIGSLPARSDPIADGVASIPTPVEELRVSGSWDREDGSHGVYRIVVTRTGTDPVTARLFVQWLAFDDSGDASIEDSVEIEEVGDLGGDIADFRSESDADGLAVYVDIVGGDADATDTYELFMFSPTDYLFGPATN